MSLLPQWQAALAVGLLEPEEALNGEKLQFHCPKDPLCWRKKMDMEPDHFIPARWSGMYLAELPLTIWALAVNLQN